MSFSASGPGLFYCQQLNTVDGQSPAPPKKPWNDDSPANTNKPWSPMISKWCEMDFATIHSMMDNLLSNLREVRVPLMQERRQRCGKDAEKMRQRCLFFLGVSPQCPLCRTRSKNDMGKTWELFFCFSWELFLGFFLGFHRNTQPRKRLLLIPPSA